jgi:hypothetical protein
MAFIIRHEVRLQFFVFPEKKVVPDNFSAGIIVKEISEIGQFVRKLF